MSDLKNLFGKVEQGYLSASYFDPANKSAGPIKVSFHQMNEIAKLEDELLDLSKQYQACFSFNVLSEKPEKGRGKNADFAAAIGVFLDVDLHEETGLAHAENDKLPESFEAVRDALVKHDLPKPTQVVDSGNDLYLRYLFDEPYFFPTDQERIEYQKLAKAFYRQFARVWKEYGWKLDDVSDLPRITRAVGTLNHKTHPPKPVQFIESSDGQKLMFEDFRRFAEAEKKSSSVPTRLSYHPLEKPGERDSRTTPMNNFNCHIPAGSRAVS